MDTNWRGRTNRLSPKGRIVRYICRQHDLSFSGLNRPPGAMNCRFPA